MRRNRPRSRLVRFLRSSRGMLVVWLALAIGGNGTLPRDGHGVVEGSLLFPACDLPADLEICVEGTVSRCTKQLHLDGKDVTYRMELPAGAYRVFARSESTLPGVRAYYSEMVRCGLEIDCTNHTPIRVEVKAGARVTGVHPADWIEPEPPALLSQR